MFSAAPTPVVTPQPISASCESGRSVSIFTTFAWLHVIWSAKVPSPVMLMATLPSARVAFGMPNTSPPIAQRLLWPWRHQKQLPHAGTNDAMTWSPTATRVTSGPTHSTMPAPSWPRMHGDGVGSVPFGGGDVGVADAARADAHDDVGSVRDRAA